jgi:hypothetical protein
VKIGCPQGLYHLYVKADGNHPSYNTGWRWVASARIG